LAFLPPYATRKRFNGPLFCLYVALHFSLLAAPFTFSWQGLATFILMCFLTICLGITLCYHRLLAHRSYQLSKPLIYFLAYLGCLAFQRGPIWWVATHRLHHSRVDRDGDPHSPQINFLWSHFLWAFFKHPQLDESSKTIYYLARDLAEDPGMCFLEKFYTAINVLFLVILFSIGYISGGEKLGVSLLVWGGFLRILYGLHITWLVNSAAHIWGYRAFNTPDKSRNNWWVALLTFGEGWHNNHHAYQRSARMGFAWYEIDLTYWLIVLLKITGYATEIIKPPPLKQLNVK
jgi:fatty-acid desaturase